MLVDEHQRLTCSKCGRSLRVKDNFYKMKTKDEWLDICKPCVTKYIDNYDPDTFKWILARLDVPYVEKVWNDLAKKEYAKNPAKFGNTSVIGPYIRTMKLKAWIKYGYADSNYLNDSQESLGDPPEPDYPALTDIPEEPKVAPQTVKIDPMIMLSPPPPPEPEPEPILEPEPEPAPPPPPPEPEPEPVIPPPPPLIELEPPPPPPPPEPEPISPISIVNEDSILNNLEEADMRYLALKWGINYRPSEWVFMEELYCKYTNEYELNADREDTLRKMCKTSLLLDRSLNEGEAQNAQKYASILDGLRKSAKFTDSQKREEQERFLDSVGELVAFCEKEGGIIDCLPDPDTYPQDKIDLTIRDLQNYTRNLAINELGLSDLIESYIAKLERREQEKLEESIEDGLITSKEEEDAYIDKEGVSYDDSVDFQNYVDTQIAEDSLMVLNMLEGN